MEFVGLDRWASFTISRDPGKVLALAAAIAAILGLCLSLFVRRRRIWVRVDPVAPPEGTDTLGAVPGAGRRPDPLGLSRCVRRGGPARDPTRWTRGCGGGDMSLAQWSNLFVYASMAMYALAMVAFAASFASARAGSVARRRPGEDVRGRSRSRWPWVRSSATAPRRPGLRPAPRPGSRAGASDRPAGAVVRPAAWRPLPPGRRAGNIGMSLTWLAFGLLVVALIARAVWAGRAPWGNMYEYSLASAAAITGVFLAGLAASRRAVARPVRDHGQPDHPRAWPSCCSTTTARSSCRR